MVTGWKSQSYNNIRSLCSNYPEVELHLQEVKPVHIWNMSLYTQPLYSSSRIPSPGLFTPPHKRWYLKSTWPWSWSLYQRWVPCGREPKNKDCDFPLLYFWVAFVNSTFFTCTIYHLQNSREDGWHLPWSSLSYHSDLWQFYPKE